MEKVTLRRFKEWVERRSGLQFSDALNVSLFVLTLVSFAIAAVGVWVAWVTLGEARRSSVDQENNTLTAQHALDTSATSLVRLNDQLNAQQEILDRSLKATQQEESLLDQSALSAREMAQSLRSIQSEPEAVAILSVQLGCDYDEELTTEPLVRVEDVKFLKFALASGEAAEVSPSGYRVRVLRKTPSHHFVFGRPTMPYAPDTYNYTYLKVQPNDTYSCNLTVRNVGNRAINKFNVKMSLLPLANSGAVEYAQGYCPMIAKTDANASVNADKLGPLTSSPVTLIDDGPLPPSATGAVEERLVCLSLVSPKDSTGYHDSGTIVFALDGDTSGKGSVAISLVTYDPTWEAPLPVTSENWDVLLPH